MSWAREGRRGVRLNDDADGGRPEGMSGGGRGAGGRPAVPLFPPPGRGCHPTRQVWERQRQRAAAAQTAPAGSPPPPPRPAVTALVEAVTRDATGAAAATAAVIVAVAVAGDATAWRAGAPVWLAVGWRPAVGRPLHPGPGRPKKGWAEFPPPTHGRITHRLPPPEGGPSPRRARPRSRPSFCHVPSHLPPPAPSLSLFVSCPPPRGK